MSRLDTYLLYYFIYIYIYIYLYDFKVTYRITGRVEHRERRRYPRIGDMSELLGISKLQASELLWGSRNIPNYGLYMKLSFGLVGRLQHFAVLAMSLTDFLGL